MYGRRGFQYVLPSNQGGDFFEDLLRGGGFILLVADRLWMIGGTIEEVGPKVTKEWKKGDRVCGFVHGGNQTQPEDGMYSSSWEGDVVADVRNRKLRGVLRHEGGSRPQGM